MCRHPLTCMTCTCVESTQVQCLQVHVLKQTNKQTSIVQGSVGVTAARFLGSSHSSEDFCLRVSSAPVVCHVNCSRTETTTSFNFKVLSVFHPSYSSSCSLNLKLLSLSDSQSEASTAFTMLKKTSWSCYKHNNKCQIKVSLHLTNCLHLTEQLSAHILSIIIWIFNCGLFHHHPLT